MSINLALASIKATGGITSRTFGNRFAQVVNVKDYGALGDGLTDDTNAIQAAFTAAQSTQYATRPIYFPHGKYMVTGVTVIGLSGTYIYGDGVNSTAITSSVSGNTAFKTNGASYNHFQDLAFITSGTGSIGFDLDWDNTGSVSLNANVFVNCSFSGEIGISIGTSGNMGSENLFLGCTWGSCSAQGLVTRNSNALDQVIIGGSASSCGSAFKVLTGSIQSIVNVGFANNTIDIDVQSNCVNAVIGCRTESASFINAAAGTFVVTACQQVGSGTSFISNMNGTVVIEACQSDNGLVTGNHGDLTVLGGSFLSTFLSGFNGASVALLGRDVRVTRTSNLTIKRVQSGTQFDNIGASGEVDFTLPTMADADNFVAGTKFAFYVGAAQTLKIIATNSLKIRNAASQSSVNGSASTATVGNYIEIEYNGVEWFTKAIVGTWTLA